MALQFASLWIRIARLFSLDLSEMPPNKLGLTVDVAVSRHEHSTPCRRLGRLRWLT